MRSPHEGSATNTDGDYSRPLRPGPYLACVCLDPGTPDLTRPGTQRLLLAHWRAWRAGPWPAPPAPCRPQAGRLDGQLRHARAPDIETWLERHARITLYFTPTSFHLVSSCKRFSGSSKTERRRIRSHWDSSLPQVQRLTREHHLSPTRTPGKQDPSIRPYPSMSQASAGLEYDPGLDSTPSPVQAARGDGRRAADFRRRPQDPPTGSGRGLRYAGWSADTALTSTAARRGWSHGRHGYGGRGR